MRKPPKPRIKKTRLAWKFERGRWIPYHRKTWSVNGKRKEKSVHLDWKGDAKKLDELYWAVESGRHDKQKRQSQYTWKALIIAWRTDAEIQMNLSESTKKTYRRDMDAILGANGDRDVRNTTKSAVRKMHAKYAGTPRKADKYLQMISLLWNYAADTLDWPLGKNPTKGIAHYGTSKPFEPWPEEMIDMLAGAPDLVRIACRLILLTGQRPNAAFQMRFDDFDGEWMRVLDEKRDEYFKVYCPEELRTLVASLDRRGEHVLAKTATEPATYWMVSNAFQKWRKTLNFKQTYVLHGLRKKAIINLAEAGCSDAEIQAVTNQSVEMVRYYRELASKKLLSKAARMREGG